MSSVYDIAVVGAGLNGLVAAAYLGKEGRRVVVLEKEDHVGGTMSTTEFAPGFKSPATLASTDLVHPSIIEDLNLGSHGLSVLRGSGPTLLTSVGESIHIPADSVAELGSGDAEGFMALQAFLDELGRVLEPALAKPLANPYQDKFSGALDLLQLGWALRKLGKKQMPEALRFLPMTIRDVMDEHFDGEPIKTLLAASALRGSWLSPRSAGGAYGLLHHNPSHAGSMIRQSAYALGGPGALTNAVKSFAESVGVEFRMSTKVESIRVEEGTCKGVRLQGGEEIEAARVVSALDPHTTLTHLTGTEWLDPEFVEKINQIRSNASVSVLHLGLSQLPRFKGIELEADALSGSVVVADSLNYIERAFDAAKYSELPDKPVLYITIPSVADSSMAPAGNHVMHVWIQYTPYALGEGSWDEQKDAFANRIVSMLDSLAPGLKDSVLHQTLVTPPDMERSFGMRNGCLYHADLTLDQLLYMRPVPRWFKYDTPIDGLHLCGAGSHPGGIGTGLPGKNAALSLI